MRRLIAIAAVLTTALAANGQEKWTLRRCIDYAVQHNIEVRQAAVSVERAELDLNTTQNSRLPALSAEAGQSFGFGRKSFQEGTSYVLRNAQSSSTSVSVTASVPVFEGFRINHQTKVDRANLAAATQNLERARQAVELNVAGFYLDVLLKKEILAVYRDQSTLLGQQVANTSMMVDEGKAAPSQLYDIKSELAAAGVKEVGARNDLSLALLTLSQVLNLDYSPLFDVADAPAGTLAVAAAGAIPNADDIYAEAQEIKPSVRAARHRLDGSQHAVNVAKSAWWPQLSLGASAGDSYDYVFGMKGQPSLQTQLRNFHNERVGLNLSIPIFNRLATRNRVRAAKLEVTGSTLELESAKLVLYKEIQQAWQRAVAAGARFDATAKALEAADESFRAMELRYGNGKATVFEYSQSSTQLTSARSEQAQARYEALFCGKILDFYSGKAIGFDD